MEISSYQADSLLSSRERSRIAEKSPVTELSGANAVGPQAEGEEDSLFDTLLDTVNPLQHIPGVSSVYQAVTGDGSNPVASMAGGFLFGGPIGLAAGAASSFFEMITGDSLAGHLASFFEGEESAPEPESGLTEVASDANPGALESLIKPKTDPLSLENYQAFAEAQSQQNLGTGAQAQDVSWTSNIWTSHALKEATGLYETNQQLGEHEKRTGDAIV